MIVLVVRPRSWKELEFTVVDSFEFSSICFLRGMFCDLAGFEAGVIGPNTFNRKFLD